MLVFLDIKDQTEYFMEKGEIRKYILLNFYSSISDFFYGLSRILNIKHSTIVHKLVS